MRVCKSQHIIVDEIVVVITVKIIGHYIMAYSSTIGVVSILAWKYQVCSICWGITINKTLLYPQTNVVLLNLYLWAIR